MSEQDGTGETDRDSRATSGQLTVETLNRYLAAATEDREAAEARSSLVIARFTRLTIAMMCVTMVIAGANVAMILRMSSPAQPAAVAPPRPVEMPTVIVQPAQPVLPAPVPTESRESPRPPEKIPLLGSPPSSKARPAPAPGVTRLARTAPPPPRSQPLLLVRNGDHDAHESSSVERW